MPLRLRRNVPLLCETARPRAKPLAARARMGHPCGMVHINGAVADPTAPFGGYRQSGNGREWGEAGFDEYLETKAVMGWSAG